MDQNRSNIDQIYHNIGARNVTQGEIGRLRNLQLLMSPAIKSRFMGNQMHEQITEEINFVNQAGIEIFDQVYNYRTELGKTLQ